MRGWSTDRDVRRSALAYVAGTVQYGRAGRSGKCERESVRQDGLFFVCRHCDGQLTVTEATLTRVLLVSAPDRPEVRVVLVDGTEVHRCTRRSH